MMKLIPRARLSAAFLGLMVTLSLAAPPAHAGDAKDWKFHPLTTAPYLGDAPTIDGNVDRAEWQAAGVLGPLMIMPEGVSDELQRRVWVGYDDTHVYFAWQIERPEHVRKPLSPGDTGHIDRWGAGDYVELMIDTTHNHKDYYDFNVYPNGAYSEGHGNPGVERGWNVDWQQAARETDIGWEGEAAIPFSAMDMDGAPDAGDVWGFDLVDNQRTPFAQVALYGFRGPSWHKFKNFGHIRFGARQPRDPAVRFMEAREAGRGKAVVNFAITNASDSASTVQANVKLLRRKAGAAGGPKSYYDHIESGADDAYLKGQVDFAKTTTLDGLVKEALDLYEPVDGGALEQELNVPAGQRRTVGFARPIEPGEFLVLYEFRRPDGAALAAGARVFRITAPLALTLEPYWLHAKKLDATADLRKVQQPNDAKLVFTIHPRDGGDEILEQAQTTVTADALDAGVTLPTEALEPGFYQVQARLIGADGEQITLNRKAIEKPEAPEWHNNSYGKRVKVPEPWTPLTAHEDGTVEVWGRTYDLSTLLPKQITSQGDALLTSPTALKLTHGGEPVDWTVESLELIESGEAHAIYRGTLESGVATLSGTVKIEFDGFAWYDMKLTPKGDALRIDHMALAVDLTPKHATLMDTHKFLHDPVLSREPVTPAKRGPGGVLAESLLPFTPHLWIGDETGGIGWIAEAPIDWHVTKPDRVLEVQPAEGASTPARMRIHMIQAPMTLKTPMRVKFGLQASPARPMPPVGTSHIAQFGGPVDKEAYYREIAKRDGRGVVYHSGWKGKPKSKIWGGWPERRRQAERRERLKKSVQLAHKHDINVSLYSGWGVATDSEAWKHFRHEMARKPLENAGFGTYRQAAGPNGAYNDYMAWAIADLIKEYGVDGVFWDSASNLREDENIRIGNGWIDKRGRVRPSFPVLGTRDLFKRIYTLVHGELKSGGQVINFGGSIWSINIYADIFHRGEGTPMHVDKLRNAWKPIEIYRANYDGRKYGVASLAMNKNFKDLPMTVNNHLAVTLLHGWHCKSNAYFMKDWAQDRLAYGRKHLPLGKVWQARAWLPLNGQAARHTFYTSGPRFIGLQPDSLMSSAFVSADGQRMLLVVSNLDGKPVEGAAVKLDLTGLGLQGGAPVRAEDAILQEPVQINDGRIQLDIEPERYRLLKIWRESE